MTTDEDAGRALFYILTEAYNEDAPLVLWLNGCDARPLISRRKMKQRGPLQPTRSLTSAAEALQGPGLLQHL